MRNKKEVSTVGYIECPDCGSGCVTVSESILDWSSVDGATTSGHCDSCHSDMSISMSVEYTCTLETKEIRG